jgi:HSP20 family protein
MTVKMEVPGVEKDQIQLTVADDHLTVRGETRKEKEEKKKNYYRQEIRYGAFQRTVALPVEVDAAKAKAELKNGLLTVTLPKSSQPKAREVKVAVG